MFSNLDDVIDRRIQELRRHAEAVSTAIKILDTVKAIGEGVRVEDYPAVREELFRLMELGKALQLLTSNHETAYPPDCLKLLEGGYSNER